MTKTPGAGDANARRRYSRPVKDRAKAAEIRHREIEELGFLCHDCGIDTIATGQYYMVADDLWDRAWRARRSRKPKGKRLPGDEVLCLPCLKRRLGRRLRMEDFTTVLPRNRTILRECL
jgi:hypothetical protein